MSSQTHENTVLIVDDDPGLARVIERKLQHEGFHTATASSGQSAKIWLQQNQADLLLLDLKLPDIAGPDLIDSLAQGGLAVPFIVITGHGDERMAVEMMKRGALDYLGKDVNFLESIPNAVRRGLKQVERDRRLEAAEKSRSESEARYRNLIGALPIAVYTCDAEGSITLFNAAAAQLWGREPALGKDRWCGSHEIADANGCQVPFDQHPMVQVIHEARPIRAVEMIIVRPDHTRRYALAFLEPVSDASGAVTGAINMLVDITESKHLKEVELARDAAERDNQAKADFIAVLSHELRNPLGPVLMLAEEGSHNPDLPASVKADFDLIAKNIGLEARLIDDLLDLTRITHGKVLMELRPVELHEVLKDALKTVDGNVNQKRITLDLDLRAAKAAVMADGMRLQQVFWNVLQNAIKFTPVCGHIRVETEAVPGSALVLVKVTDSGIGLTEKELDRIYDSFSQGDHARNGGSRCFSGLGLGLSIARKLLDLHSGRISAVSAGRGKGSTFTIELPLMDRLAATLPDTDKRVPQPAVAEPMPPPGCHILVVEDHEASRNILVRLLERRRYEVTAAATKLEALEFAHGGIDIVLSDIGLPDGNGYDLMLELHRRFPDLVGIAMSGYGMEEDIRRSHAAGFVAHLVKPARLAEVQVALAKAFAARNIAEADPVWQECTEESVQLSN